MTTQDKPAVGPLSAGDVKLLVKGDVIENLDGGVAPKGTLMTVTGIDDEGIDVMDRGEANSFFFQTVAGSFRLVPTAPVETLGETAQAALSAGKKLNGWVSGMLERAVSTQPDTGKVEAGGVEREHGPKCWGKTSLSDEMAHCYCGSTDLHPQPSGDQVTDWAEALYSTNTFYKVRDDWREVAPNDGGIHDLHMNMARAAKRVWDRADSPQPSGETREKLALRLEAVEPIVREAVLSASVEVPEDAVARAEMRVEITRNTTDAILALLRPAAPDGGGLADLAARVTAEVKRGADGSHVQALGALSNIEAMVRAAIPASEGGEG